MTFLWPGDFLKKNYDHKRSILLVAKILVARFCIFRYFFAQFRIYLMFKCMRNCVSSYCWFDENDTNLRKTNYKTAKILFVYTSLLLSRSVFSRISPSGALLLFFDRLLLKYRRTSLTSFIFSNNLFFYFLHIVYRVKTFSQFTIFQFFFFSNKKFHVFA